MKNIKKSIKSLSGKKYIKENIIKGLFGLNGLLVIFILIAILVLLISKSYPFFEQIGFLPLVRDKVWNANAYRENTYGIRTLVTGTLMVTIGSLVMAAPLGVASASYMSELAHNKTREILKPFIEILAGIPSVVIGFFGLVVLNPIIARLFNLSNGLNAVNGSILLAIMSVPTIITLSEDAIYSVPLEYKEASLALGANEWQTLWRVTLPAAKSGITASIMLGMGRAIGETMTVLMATGNVRAMPKSFLDPIMTLTATVAIELGEVPFNTIHYYGLFVIGLVLFLMTFLVNMTSDIILNKKRL